MKKERGSITILTLVTILFMISFLISTFVIIANRRQAQTEIKRETQDIYEGDVKNIEQIYNSYFASADEVIPIATVDNLFKVGTDEYIVANDKIYKCSANANYKLVKNLSFAVADYSDKISTEEVTWVETGNETQTAIRWVDIEKQIENGTLTGNFDYNGNKIIETDGGGNTVEHKHINYVNYIESTGTQYIDTGIQPDANTTFELSISLNDLTNIQSVMGAREAIKSAAYNIFVVDNGLRWDYNTDQTPTNLAYSTNTKIKITKTASQMVVETGGQTKTITDSNTSFTTPYNLYLFTINTKNVADTRIANMKVYYFKIYKNGVLIRDFAPALDSNNVPCLYDKLSNQYFYNIGTGDFNYQ